jgi:hypothetical protein
MRNAHSMLLGLFLGAGAFTTGCGSAAGDGSAVGSSQARMVFVAKGSQPATLHVTATDDATSAVALDKTVDVQGNSAAVVDVSLVPASYTFVVDAIGGASGDATLGSDSAQVDLTDGETTQITLAAQVDAGAGSDGSAQVQIGVDVAPVIEGVTVQLAGGSSADAAVHIDVDATDTAGGALTFFWSGAGLLGAVQGSSSLTIPASAVAAAAAGGTSPVVHVTVEDVQGATAQADIALAMADGAVQGTLTAASTASAMAAECLQAQAKCNAGCSPGLSLGGTGLDVNASCVAGCGLSFASCEAP